MNIPRMRTTDLPGCPFQLNGVEIPVEQWNVDHGGYLGSEAPVRVQLTFFARFEPEPETAEQRGIRLRAEEAAELAALVAEWQAVRDRYAGSPAVQFALDFHQPRRRYALVQCDHCQTGDDTPDADYAPWPCATFAALAATVEQLAESNDCEAFAPESDEPVQPILVTVNVNGEHVVDAWHLGRRS